MDTGNTALGIGTAVLSAVHPRGYGEHLRGIPVNAREAGSSPWIRGTPSKNTNAIMQEPVHPRGYGEHDTQLSAVNDGCGSSPWIRGTLVVMHVPCSHKRFIPVDTGNTMEYLYQYETHAVHPRGYGEHRVTPANANITAGSSPWIRGTPI